MKITHLFCAAAMCVSACALQEPPPPSAGKGSALKSDWNVRDHIPADKIIVQSHRGAGELAPENTIEAFELGWKLGTIPEADLRTTSDGVIVAFHDASFKRVVKNADPELLKKGVTDITYAELSKLDVGSWKGDEFSGRRVSRMTDVFQTMTGKPARRLYLDIKNVDLKQLAGEVREHKVGSQVILASTHHHIIREWKSLVPESDTLLWMGGAEADLSKRIAELRKTDFSGITQLQIHARLNKDKSTGETFVPSRSFFIAVGAELRGRGILFQSLPWGAAEPELYWQLLDLGVASFATDHPEVTLKAIRDYYAQPRARRQL
jgi:glycerophosphoryl diester phosphodiesterase